MAPGNPYQHKLTDQQAKDLVDDVRRGMKVADAARKYGVGHASADYRVTEAAVKDLLRIVGWPSSLATPDIVRRAAEDTPRRTTQGSAPNGADFALAARAAGDALQELARVAEAPLA